MTKKIKDRLKILLLALSLIVALPAFLHAGDGTNMDNIIDTNLIGDTTAVMDARESANDAEKPDSTSAEEDAAPDFSENTKLRDYLQANDTNYGSETKTKDKTEGNLLYKDQGTTTISGTTSSADGAKIEHATVTMDPEWVKANDDAKIAAVGQVAGQMAQMPTPEMSDPRAESIMGVTKNAMGAGASLAVAGYYMYKGTQYENAEGENEKLMERNETVKNKIVSAIQTKQTNGMDMENEKDNLKNLRDYKEKVESALKSQDAAEWDAAGSKWKSRGMAMFGLFQTGALAWTAAQSLDQAKKLGGEFQPPAGGSASNQPPDGPQGPYERGQGFLPTADRSPSDETTGFPTASGDNSLLEPAGGDFANGADSSFLAASGDAFGAGIGEKDSETARGTGEISSKQYYDQAAGSAASGSYYDDTAVASSGFGGFDISQFLPPHLRGQDDAFLMKTVNKTSKGGKSVVLGKDSPSLFTRVSKAHQKKAHELGWEI